MTSALILLPRGASFLEWKTDLMNRRTQLSLFGAILGLASFLPGCDQGNEKNANIKGVVPTDTASETDRRSRSRGADKTSAPAGYPGAAPAKKN